MKKGLFQACGRLSQATTGPRDHGTTDTLAERHFSASNDAGRSERAKKWGQKDAFSFLSRALLLLGFWLKRKQVDAYLVLRSNNQGRSEERRVGKECRSR